MARSGLLSAAPTTPTGSPVRPTPVRRWQVDLPHNFYFGVGLGAAVQQYIVDALDHRRRVAVRAVHPAGCRLPLASPFRCRSTLVHRTTYTALQRGARQHRRPLRCRFWLLGVDEFMRPRSTRPLLNSEFMPHGQHAHQHRHRRRSRPSMAATIKKTKKKSSKGVAGADPLPKQLGILDRRQGEVDDYRERGEIECCRRQFGVDRFPAG